ncbi:MAG TPA: RimK/LysX family protein [Candidatus Saccharimonadales bacterium]|nr:RimK/LysX family protein [Candidatus Saccharimonadales bacterium]
MDSKIIGAFEKVSFPDFGLVDLVAKIDTGALSGALHATGITEVDLPTGQKAVSFLPYGREPRVEVADFEKKLVKSSNGKSEERYVIATTVVIRGVQYPIHISLSDRSNMMKGVLVGRRFLRQHGFLVDASGGAEYRYEVK